MSVASPLDDEPTAIEPVGESARRQRRVESIRPWKMIERSVKHDGCGLPLELLTGIGERPAVLAAQMLAGTRRAGGRSSRTVREEP